MLTRRCPRLSFTRVLSPALALVAAAACSSSDSGGTQPVAVASVGVTAPAQTLPVYGTLQLTATPRDGNGNALNGRSVTWSSSSDAVATVSTSGLVAAASAGPVTISAASEGRTGTIALTVSPAPVDTVRLDEDALTLDQGATQLLVVTLTDEQGVVLTDRNVSWTTDDAIVAGVSPGGMVSALAGGVATITASAEGRSASAAVTVRDTIAAVVVEPDAVPLETGETTTLTVTVRNDAGEPLTDRPVAWTSSNEAVAAVSDAGLVTAGATGVATITATAGSKSDQAVITVTAADGPIISSITPATLVPGASATITGTGFSAVLSENIVTMGGVAAAIASGGATQLQVTVPCAASGNVAVIVNANGDASAPFAHPLQVGSQHTLGVGESVVITDPADVPCTELPASGVQSRYAVAVYNSATSPNSFSSYQLAGSMAGVSPDLVAGSGSVVRRVPRLHLTDGVQLRRQGDAGRPWIDERAHHRLLEKNAAAYERLAHEYAGTMRPRASADVFAADPPPPAHTIRVANINGSLCTDFFEITATRVYYSGKLAIYEDDATPDELKAANNAAMAGYYQQIGDQFNADMEPVVSSHFGDVLRRDAETDDNGVLIAVFTPVINNEMPNVAGFVVSCDQFPNGANNTASNFGEYFYAHLPEVAGTGYNDFTPDSWYRSIRTTFIHETKHAVSMAARVANNAPTFEASWLEEGTARHAEELWARQAIYDVAWKGNTGYGSPGDPGSIYCDVRPTVAACSASNPRRPSLNMWRHFSTLYGFLGNSWALSPFGSTIDDDAGYFYAVSWSLVRYSADRFGTTEPDFFTQLTQASTSGMANLSARTGLTTAELLGRWALALYADDVPAAAGNADVQIPTWNVPNIYAGLKADFPAAYPRATPIMPVPLGLGTIAPQVRDGIVGGGVDYYELTGLHSGGQVLRVESTLGGPPPGTIHVAIVRVQ